MKGPWAIAGCLRVWNLTNTSTLSSSSGLVHHCLKYFHNEWPSVWIFPVLKYLMLFPSVSPAVMITVSFVLGEPFEAINLRVTPINCLRLEKKQPLWRGSHSTFSLSIFPRKEQTLSLSIAFGWKMPQGVVIQHKCYENEDSHWNPSSHKVFPLNLRAYNYLYLHTCMFIFQ